MGVGVGHETQTSGFGSDSGIAYSEVQTDLCRGLVAPVVQPLQARPFRKQGCRIGRDLLEIAPSYMVRKRSQVRCILEPFQEIGESQNVPQEL